MTSLKSLMLQDPRLTVAAAESLTCGRMQAELGSVSGSSEYFLGGITAYTLEQKVTHLRVDRQTAKAVNCVSAEVAEQMARGVCELFHSDLGVATTGYAEPFPAQGVASPFAWWALAHRQARSFLTVRSGRIECPGASRVDVQQMIAAAVVGELATYLETYRTNRS